MQKWCNVLFKHVHVIPRPKTSETEHLVGLFQEGLVIHSDGKTLHFWSPTAVIKFLIIVDSSSVPPYHLIPDSVVRICGFCVFINQRRNVIRGNSIFWVRCTVERTHWWPQLRLPAQRQPPVVLSTCSARFCHCTDDLMIINRTKCRLCVGMASGLYSPCVAVLLHEIWVCRKLKLCHSNKNQTGVHSFCITQTSQQLPHQCSENCNVCKCYPLFRFWNILCKLWGKKEDTNSSQQSKYNLYQTILLQRRPYSRTGKCYAKCIINEGKSGREK